MQAFEIDDFEIHKNTAHNQIRNVTRLISEYSDPEEPDYFPVSNYRRLLDALTDFVNKHCRNTPAKSYNKNNQPKTDSTHYLRAQYTLEAESLIHKMVDFTHSYNNLSSQRASNEQKEALKRFLSGIERVFEY
ncbi:hypothetical protein [Teredinibacter sp. KSP-S5-2]|uniref:hypothetical protein n=1 Tax=Teredinibacter sp. KSP-S5-2 TaxID=3034506 RepID=UPI0029343B02|nr:hypothetical protein [Teredinibacter sp. KSP-S5-2]WNO10421.1 hypothetical protein P5V12_04480 [Teredinibacter sp. KSP-S5-2]